jgi:hypothetical protein
LLRGSVGVWHLFIGVRLTLSFKKSSRALTTLGFCSSQGAPRLHLGYTVTRISQT